MDSVQKEYQILNTVNNSKLFMPNSKLLDKIFDDLLFQLSKGNTFENIEKGRTILDLET